MILPGNCVRSLLPLLHLASSSDTGQGDAALGMPWPRSPLHNLLL